jgi:hypothetical protein
MTTDLICPNCHISLDEDRLLTTTQTVESCPNCRAVIRYHESFNWQDRDAIAREDREAIEKWLSEVVSNRPMAWGAGSADSVQGKAIWDVQGVEIEGESLSWGCTVQYDTGSPRVLELRLTARQDLPSGLDEKQTDRELARLEAICARHGVQAHAVWESRMGWGGPRSEVRWGTRQFLTTTSLVSALFWGVLGRLDGAMNEAALHLEVWSRRTA